MGVDVGVEDGSRIEVTFEEVNNENINVELIDNPVTIELDTPGNIQVSFNEQYSDVNVILDHDKQINRNLNKQHTADTIQESTSKRFTSDLEISNLEPKRGIDDFYLSGDEKSKLDRLLVDFTIPSNTTSILFDRDKTGVLFSSMGLSNIAIQYFIKTTNSVSTTALITVNGINSGYKQFGGTQNGILYRIGLESAGSVLINTLGGKLTFESRSHSSNTELNDATVTPSNYWGSNRLSFLKINTVLLASSLFGETIATGSTIKIYRND